MGRTKTPHLILLASLFLVTPQAVMAETDASARAEAEQRIAVLPQGGAAAAYRLALELEAKGHADLARRAYDRVLAAEPDHRAARRALGFERFGGRWLTGDDLLRAKGLVSADGRWILAQQVGRADPNLHRLRKAEASIRSGRSASRIRAAQEIARIGDERGIAILVGAWARAETRAATGYFSQAQQRSYVQDFDVDVA